MKKNNSLSDDYIEEHFVDGAITHNGPIELVDYRPEWVELYQREEKAIMIEHIGSTSVPGLCAKPIIDILLVVKDAGNEDNYLPDLLKNGYILRIKEPEFENHHMFKGPDTNINLHVFSVGSQEIDKYLILRNELRENSKARELYAQTKLKLAQRTWKYVQNYADAKSDVIQSIINQAKHKENE